MRFPNVAAVGLLVLLACADAYGSASGRPAIVAGEDGQQVIINQQTSDMPIPLPGMGPRQPKTGTGRLRGRAITADAGSPVRLAVVRISSPDIGSKTAMTDAQGRYEFRDLPAGRFNLSASKAGYVTMQYGQTRPFEQGKPIDLAEGQALDKADFVMPRGSVISGRVVDEFGDPMSEAIVMAMRSVWAGGRRRLQATGRSATTNDLGQFRIYGLSPGDYYVSATIPRAEMIAFDMAMAMGGGGAGGPVGSNPNSGYAPTYFPGTSNGAEAQKIAVGAGQEAANTDFALLPVRLVKVTGIVLSSEGKPVEGAMISAQPKNMDGAGMMMAGTGRSDKNGAFTISNISPGDYTLQSRSFQIQMSSGGDNMTFTTRIGGPEGGSDNEVGSLPITVGGEDLTNVVLVTAKGASATGRVTFEGGAPPTNLTNIRVMPVSADAGDAGPTMVFGGPNGLKADGTFEVKGLVGTRLLRLMNVPAGWTVKSVRVNGTDVTDTGIEFKPGETVSGVEIALSSKLSQVSGTVTGASSEPVKDYTVVVFADDPQRWTLPGSRYVAGRRPDLNGKFEVKPLPPGSYYAAAVEYLPDGDWNDPEVLERLKVNAKRFTLDEGESKTLELKIQ
jgi:protocatechuate 3,4-dioxygenase beta subunit